MSSLPRNPNGGPKASQAGTPMTTGRAFLIVIVWGVVIAVCTLVLALLGGAWAHLVADVFRAGWDLAA